MNLQELKQLGQANIQLPAGSRFYTATDASGKQFHFKNLREAVDALIESGLIDRYNSYVTHKIGKGKQAVERNILYATKTNRKTNGKFGNYCGLKWETHSFKKD